MPQDLNILLAPQRDYLVDWLSKKRISNPVRLELLAGDGSSRKFYRLTFQERQHEKAFPTLVLLSDPEWISSKDYPAHQAYLASLGLPVPAFVAIAPEVGMLLMEDVGDEYLQSRVALTSNPMRFWEAAISLIADFHGKTYPVPAELPGATRRFDRQKLSEELKFMAEHLVVGFLQLKPPTQEKWKKVEDFCEELAHLMPLVLCHRDYHSRNLMVHRDKLVLLDFQDARLGPPHYDLASLLFDPYAPLDESHRTELMGFYLKTLSRYPVASQLSPERFEQELKAIAFQRVMKASGSFASFYTRFKKITHLRYLIPSLQSAFLLQQSGAVPSVISSVFPVDQYLGAVKEKLAIFEAEGVP